MGTMGRIGTGRGRSVGALLVLLIVAACGSTSSAPSSGGGRQQLGGSASVWGVWSGTEQQDFQQVLDGLHRQSGVTAAYQSKGDNLPTVLGTAISGGSPPDVAILPQPGLLDDLAGKGSLKPVDGIVGAQMGSDYAPVWKDLASSGGKLYGVYFKAANKSTVWYNTKVFKDAGVTPPTDWTRLLAAMATLKRYGVAPFAMCGGSGWTLTDWFENIYLRSAGKDKYNALAQHQIPWTDPSVATAFQYMKQIFGDPSNMVGGTQGAVSTPFPDCVNQAFGPSPKAAMVFEADFVASTIQGLSGSPQPGTDYNFFPFPSIMGSPAAVSAGGDVAVMLRDTPQSEALIRYLASPQAAEIWAKLGGFTSPNTRVPLSVYPNSVARKAAKALIDAGDNVVFDMSDRAPAAFGGTAGSGEWADLQNWVRNPADITATLDKLEADAKRAYGH